MAFGALNPFDVFQPFRTLVGGEVAWTPSKITTALWLDAADASTLTLDGSLASQWDDKSGNLRHATQGGAALQPTYDAVNNALDFDRDLMMLPTNIAALNSVSAFVVAKFSDTVGAANYVLFAKGDGTTRFYSSSMTNNSAIFLWNVETSSPFGFSTADNNAHMFGLTHGSDSAVAYLDGDGISTSARTGTATITNWVLGGINDTTSRFIGSIYEVIVVGSLVSATYRQKIEGYLAWKWGLVAKLPAGHPYKNSRPRVA